MSDHCEPPEGAKFGSEHFIELDGKEVIAGWSPVDRLWTPARASSFHCDSPYAQKHGLRYLAPVTPPDVVARLRVDLARLVEAAERVDAAHAATLRAATLGLPDWFERTAALTAAKKELRAALAAIKERTP